jgi:hypothetical protein
VYLCWPGSREAITGLRLGQCSYKTVVWKEPSGFSHILVNYETNPRVIIYGPVLIHIGLYIFFTVLLSSSSHPLQYAPRYLRNCYGAINNKAFIRRVAAEVKMASHVKKQRIARTWMQRNESETSAVSELFRPAASESSYSTQSATQYRQHRPHGVSRIHLRGYAKTSYWVCKIERVLFRDKSGPDLGLARGNRDTNKFEGKTLKRNYVRSEVFTAVTTKNGVFWDVTRLLVTASVFPSSPILVTLMKEALSSSETSVLTRATRRNIPADSILQENLHLGIPKRGLNNTDLYAYGDGQNTPLVRKQW